jgi:DNA helicase IV
VEGALRDEQVHLDACYHLLSDLQTQLEERIESISRAPSTGTGQDLIERDAMLDLLIRQLQSARAAGSRLCFGRIDSTDGTCHHIGRIGLRTPAGDPVVLDWRAPNAAPFYQATAAHPMGVSLRRRIVTRDRTVTHIEDEDLNDPTATTTSGSAASAVEAPREGRMGDIVATIAADQDAIIRSPLNQVTVVEGGPGTGKTVVALHRAAWLLYTHRDRLAKDGVLVIGPSPTFLHYIDQVLPSLGETDVVLQTPGQLYPGIDARIQDSDEVAAIKGDLRMARVIAAAVRSRIRVPERGLTITLDDGMSLTLSARAFREARRAVPRSASFHAGREPFLTRLLQHLATERARALREDPGDAEVRGGHIADLVEDVNVRRTLNLMWLPTTPERLVGRLFAEPDLLAECSEGILSPAEQQALLRPMSHQWTVDDVPLLDEAADLLGPWDPQAQRRSAQERAERRQEIDHAQQALADTGMSGWIDAAGLVDRMSSGALMSTVAERAAADRTWVFGHIVVDEAQELSAMAWHVLARRATRRSMTIVGDLQQASHPAGPRTWQEALAEVRGTVDLHSLTVTYRITRQIAEEATRLLTEAGGQAPALQPIREGDPVAQMRVPIQDLAETILAQVASREGRAAVIVPDTDATSLAALLTDASSEFGAGDLALDAPVAVLTARDTKGLEFDQVFVVDPHRISTQGRQGSDIYVAATRATKYLHLLTVVR